MRKEPDVEILFEQLQARLARADRSWLSRLRSLSTPLRRFIALAATIVPWSLGMLFAQRQLRAVWEAYATSHLLGVLLALLMFLLFAVWLCTRPLYQPALPQGVTVGFVTLIAIGSAGIAWLAPLSEPWSIASLTHQVHASLRGHDPCLYKGLFIVGLPMYALVHLLNRGVWWSAYLNAGVAGLSAMLMLQVQCSINHRLHYLMGHAGVLLTLLSAVGLLYAIQRVRAKPRPAVDDP